jgi:hypothetical protein
MMDEDSSVAILTMLEMGATVRDVTDMIVTAGIGGGKWSVDYGILLAGPIANTICLMAKKYGIDYDLGVKNTSAPVTKASFRALEKINAGDAGEASASVGAGLGITGATPPEQTTAPAPSPKGGFGGMAKAPPAGGVQEQEAMLGQTDPTEGEY